MRIPLTSRRAECPMPLPVTDRRATVTPDTSLLAAGADVAEADPAQAVASDPSVIDAERDPLYGDGVKHATDDELQRMLAQLRACDANYAASMYQREIDRRSRLSRWQEQR